jgi:hypothetical protein
MQSLIVIAGDYEAEHNIGDSGRKKYRGHHARPAKHQSACMILSTAILIAGKADERQRQAKKDGSVQKAGAIADNKVRGRSAGYRADCRQGKERGKFKCSRKVATSSQG